MFLSVCTYNRQTQVNTQNKHKQASRITTQPKYIISQPEPEIYVFAVGSWAGYPVFQFCCVSRSFCGFVDLSSCLLVCACLVFLSCCIYNRTTSSKHSNTQHICITTGFPFMRYFPCITFLDICRLENGVLAYTRVPFPCLIVKPCNLHDCRTKSFTIENKSLTIERNPLV